MMFNRHSEARKKASRRGSAQIRTCYVFSLFPASVSMAMFPASGIERSRLAYDHMQIAQNYWGPELFASMSYSVCELLVLYIAVTSRSCCHSYLRVKGHSANSYTALQESTPHGMTACA